MLDLSDYYQCDFYDFSDGTEPFFKCTLTLPDLGYYGTIELSNYYLRDILAPSDEPDIPDYEQIKTSINDKIDEIKKVKNDIDKFINNSQKIKKIFDILENYIIPRLKSFDNCTEITVGFDDNEIWIYYDIKL